MDSLLRKTLKKFAKPGMGLVRLMTKAEHKILSFFGPEERARLTQQQIDILLSKQPQSPIARANALNKELFADIYAIPEHERIALEVKIRAFCKKRNFLPDYTEAVFSHRYRFYFTLKWLRSIPGINTALVALELGGEDVATDLLREYFPQVQWLNTQGDLRQPWSAIANDSLDLIISMEIVEHLADLPDGINHGFFGTGLKAFLAEAHRTLKSDGVLFITTPNVGSIVHLIYALDGNSPWLYSLHNREYTIYDLEDALGQSGFTIDRWKAVHCMSVDAYTDHTPAFQLLLSHSHQTANRGDDLFIIARKTPKS
jgi:hypothetical protein